jgi:hypothetical protein
MEKTDNTYKHGFEFKDPGKYNICSKNNEVSTENNMTIYVGREYKKWAK